MLSTLLTTKVNTMKMNALDKVSMLLLMVGGVNWGLVGWLKYNLVDEIFGVESTGSRVIYAVVGVAALYSIYGMVKMLSSPSNKA